MLSLCSTGTLVLQRAFNSTHAGNICTQTPTDESGKMTPLTQLFEDAHLFDTISGL